MLGSHPRAPLHRTINSLNRILDQLLRVNVGVGFKRARLQYVYSILRGKDLETGQFSDDRRVAQFDDVVATQSFAICLQCGARVAGRSGTVFHRQSG